MRKIFTFVALAVFAVISFPFRIRTFVTVFSLAVFAGVSSLAFLPDLNIQPEYSPLFAAGVFVALLVPFIYNGIRETRANPPHVSVLTVFRMRTGIVLSEGLNWIPLYGIVLGHIPIDVTMQTVKLGPVQVRTPDNGLVRISGYANIVPGIKGRRNSYKTWLNAGGLPGVTAALAKKFAARVREWGSSDDEGPATWKEALTLRVDAYLVLVEALLGRAMGKFESPIPSSVWVRFFSVPRPTPTTYDVKNKWASEEGGQRSWAPLQAKFDGYTPEAKARLIEQVASRRQNIDDLRDTTGEFGDVGLGFTFQGFSLDEVEAEGEVAEAAADEERERLEALGDTVEIKNLSARATSLKADHPGLSSQEAIRAIQLERGKVRGVVVDFVGAPPGQLARDMVGYAAAAGTLPGAAPPQASTDQGGVTRGTRRDTGEHDDESPAAAAPGASSAGRTKADAQRFFDQHHVWPYWDPEGRKPAV